MKKAASASKKTKVARKKRTAKVTDNTVGEAIQLTIASYGKRKSVEAVGEEEDVVTSSVNVRATPKAGSRRAGSPVILSLPVSNAMEDRHFNRHTLDNELTEYKADVLAAPIPQSLLAATQMSAEAFEGGKEVIFTRCDECRMNAGPCDDCIIVFNAVHAKTLEDYTSTREKDDFMFGAPDPRTFFNELIHDEPPPVIAEGTEPPVYNPREMHDRYTLEDEACAPAGIDQVTVVQQSDDDDDKVVGPPPMRDMLVADDREKEDLRNEVEFLRQQIETLRLQSHESSVAGVEASAAGKMCCMWHLGPITSEVLGLPTNYDETTRSYETIGRFCSFQCMYAYRLEHKSAECAPLWLLFRAFREVDTTGGKLRPARPRQELARFGGALTDEEFIRASCDGSWPSVLRNPFLPSTEFVVTDFSVGGAGASAAAAQPTANIPSVMTTAPMTNELVRKRNKPHPNAENQWHNTMRRSRLRK